MMLTRCDVHKQLYVNTSYVNKHITILMKGVHCCKQMATTRQMSLSGAQSLTCLLVSTQTT